jgi:peptidoglycan hydrolase CwlO-like protein
MTSAYYWNKHRSIDVKYLKQYDELTQYKQAVSKANEDLKKLFDMYTETLTYAQKISEQNLELAANLSKLKDELTSVKSDLYMSRSNEN